MAFRSPRKTGLPCAAVLSLATSPDSRPLSANAGPSPRPAPWISGFAISSLGLPRTRGG